MNKILLSWHEKGIHTEADILEKDSRPAPAKAANDHRGAVTDDELRRLRSIYEKVKNG